MHVCRQYKCAHTYVAYVGIKELHISLYVCVFRDTVAGEFMKASDVISLSEWLIILITIAYSELFQLLHPFPTVIRRP